MAIGDSSWELVVRHTFVEMVQTQNKTETNARARSEGGLSLPVLPTVADFTEPSTPPSVGTSSIRVSSREPQLQRESASFQNPVAVQPQYSKKTSAIPTPQSQHVSPAKPARFGWCARLCGAVGQKPLEDKGQSFSEMHNSLDRGVPGASSSRWQVVTADAPRGLRTGESFRVSEECVGKDGVVHLCLADGGGWVVATKPTGELMCQRVKHRHRSSRDPLPQPQVMDQLKPQTSHVSDQVKAQTFSWDDATEEELLVDSPRTERRTTVVMTEIPCDCSRDGLVARLDDAGLVGQYDFVYLPVSFETLSTHGYGIVNFVSSQAAQTLIDKFPSSANWSDQRQGLNEHVANFQDSSLMHDGVPDQFKPILFRDGNRVAFPAPTRQTRMPRELKRAICRMRSGELAGNSKMLTASEGWTPKPQSEPRSPCVLESPKSDRGEIFATNFRRIRSRRVRRSVS